MPNVFSYAFYRNAGLVGTQNIMTPAGYTMVLKELNFYNGSVGLSNNVFWLRDVGTGAALWRFDWSVGPSSGTLQFTCRMVFGTGSGFQMQTGTHPIDIIACGYVLSGIAPVAITGAPIP